MVNRTFLLIDHDKLKMHIVIPRSNTKSSIKRGKIIFSTNGAGKKYISMWKNNASQFLSQSMNQELAN